VLAPAFQWAQSLDNVFINIKYATRFDTPGCLETFNENITIEENRLNISIYCRHDKTILKYELDLELFDTVDVQLSKYEQSSVGRLYVNLVKTGRPNRWRRLLKGTEKLSNMGLWWELHEKHEEALLNHTQFETDENMEHLIHIENSPKKKSTKKSSKKSKKAKDEPVDPRDEL